MEILETVNPANKAGKVTLITRMSSKYLDEHLPKLILAVQKAGLNVSTPEDSRIYDAASKDVYSAITNQS